MSKRISAAALVLSLALSLALPALAADKAAEATETVQSARTTLRNFVTDPNMKWIKEHIGAAKGILIVPTQGKGGFIFGGSGGVGVLLTRTADGTWSQPAFYRMGSVSVGLLVGGEVSEVMFFIQTQKGVDSFLASSFKFGAEASVAAGPVGQGAKTSTADILSFSRSKGAYIGASFDGTIVKPAADLNQAFYKKPASPLDILVRATVQCDLSEGLRGDLERDAQPKAK
jgi:SH3 domain-containing YSC84-like protein 1